MDNFLTLSVSPHIHSGRSTAAIMRDVLIALLPTTVAGTLIFGLRSLLVVAVCVASCVLLFSYRKYDSFPVDVWVKRILQKYYDGKADAEYFGRYAGLCQQYLFYYERCENNVFLN